MDIETKEHIAQLNAERRELYSAIASSTWTRTSALNDIRRDKIDEISAKIEALQTASHKA